MFESGGIGAQIDKKVGALTGNPQAMQQLQQKQKTQQGKGVTPDLLDALALQKVMSDKALAKQQLALSQQQDAGTVVEQMEQKLVGMNKEELTAQTAGILGERNKKRNQQISAGKPPQQQGQRPPMQMAQGAPQGAPQGLPAAPRPPTQFAAQGGIIGYQGGGQIDKVKAFIASKDGKLSQQEMADIVNASKNNPEVIAFLTQSQGYIGSAEMTEIDKAAGLTAPAGAPVANASIAAATAKGVGKDKPNTGITTVPAGGLGVPPSDKEVDKPNTGIATVPAGGLGVPPATASAVPAGGLGVPSAAAPAGDSTDPLKGALGAAGIKPTQISPEGLTGKFGTNASKTQVTDAVGEKTTGIMQAMRDKDPQASRISEETRQDVRYDRDAKRKAEEDLIAEKRALDDKQLDPKAVAMERANAGIRGLIEGGTSRGASIARGKFDANVSQRQRDAINETIKLTRDKDKSDDDRIKAVDETAGKVFERESADRIAAIQGLAGMAGQDVTAANVQAKIEFDANKFNIKTKLDALAIDAKQELNRLIQENANVTQYAALLKQVQAGQIAALNAMYASQAEEIKQAETNVLAGTASANEIKMVQDKQIKYMAILDMAGLHDLIEELRTAAVKGTSKNTPTNDLDNAMGKYN